MVAAESQAKKRKMPQEEAPKRVKGKQPDVQPTPLTQEQKELQKNLVDLTCLQTDSEDEAACAAAASKGKKEAAKLKAQERKDLRAQQKAAAQDHKKTFGPRSQRHGCAPSDLRQVVKKLSANGEDEGAAHRRDCDLPD